MTVLFNKPCIIFHYMTLSEDLSVCAHVLLVLYSSPSPRMYVWVHAKPKRKAKQEHTDMGVLSPETDEIPQIHPQYSQSRL